MVGFLFHDRDRAVDFLELVILRVQRSPLHNGRVRAWRRVGFGRGTENRFACQGGGRLISVDEASYGVCQLGQRLALVDCRVVCLDGELRFL